VAGAWPQQGGATGSIRFNPEITHGANAGGWWVQMVRQWCVQTPRTAIVGKTVIHKEKALVASAWTLRRPLQQGCCLFNHHQKKLLSFFQFFSFL
jgi:hypothetical protein